MEEIFQIRIGGQVVSQMRREDVHAAVASGTLTQFHQISPDGVNWYDLSELDDAMAVPPETAQHSVAETNVTSPEFPTPHPPSANPQAPVSSSPPPTTSPIHSTPDSGPPATPPSSVPSATPIAPITPPINQPKIPETPSNVSSTGLVVGTDISKNPSRTAGLSGADAGHPTHLSSDSQANTTQSTGWHVMVDTQRLGPLHESNLLQMVTSGQVEADNYVWREGTSEWVLISRQFPNWFDGHHRQRSGVPKEDQTFSMMSIASLICALLWFGGIGSMLAVVLALMGITDIMRAEGYRKGWIFAVFGMLIGLSGSIGSFVFWIWVTS